MAGKLEDHLSVVRLYGLQTDKDAVFNGSVTFNGEVNTDGAVVLSPASSLNQIPIQNALDEGKKVFLRNGIYNISFPISLLSNAYIEGESKTGVVIKMGASLNLSCFRSDDTTNGVEFVTLKNMTIDSNGDNQSSGGGGASFQGLRDSLFQDIVFKKSYNFCFFVQGVAGTLLTGTLTFTNGDATVSGSGTAFTTELSVGDIVKSAGGKFQRVQSIASNTSLELDKQWQYATESGVTARNVPANARNRIINCEFQGTVANDNCGLGLFDDSLIQGCISYDATGYGFGPDHSNRVKFIGNTSYGNVQGFGIETCGYCVFDSNIAYGNSQSGMYLLAGSYRNVISNNILRGNSSSGINISYNSTSAPAPDENSLIGNECEINGVHGIRIGGASRTIVNGNRCFNNDQIGIVVVTENSLAPVKTQIIGNSCYDSQDTKTQDRGIHIINGTDALVTNNISSDADHVTEGITDAGTTTTLANNI